MRAPEPEPRRRSRLGLALAVIVPALLAGGGVLWLGAQVENPELPTAAMVRSDARPRTLGARASRALRPVVATAGRAGVRGNDLEDLAGGVRPAVPDRIAIPAARVDTVVDAVDTDRAGAIRVPSLGRAGWYEGGPRPGEPGRAVIIGHLDTERGPGLFARIPSLQAGEAIRITDRRGAERRYEVVGSVQVRKDRFPTEEVYGGSGGTALVLVTCGGPYDEERGYRDNILVYARAA